MRATGLFRPERTGVHRFHLGATGTATLRVDGRELVATPPRAPGDVMGVLKSGDAEVAEVELAAGREVRVEVLFRFEPARVQGLWYGIRGPAGREEMLARAEAAARDADAVFLLVGETSDSSVESKDRPDTALPPDQVELIRCVCAANPRTVVIANVGHAFDASWEDGAAALIAAWYPGEGFARALADVLAGDREPGGRLPVTLAREEGDYPGYALTPGPDGRLVYGEGVRFGYRGLIAAGRPARHPFGSGVGYARFDWSEARIDGAVASVLVRNASDRAGAEVVQLYRDVPETTLIGFAKVRLEPGEERRVSIPAAARRLQTWGADGWEPLPGEVPLRLARHAEDPGHPLAVRFAQVGGEGA